MREYMRNSSNGKCIFFFSFPIFSFFLFLSGEYVDFLILSFDDIVFNWKNVSIKHVLKGKLQGAACRSGLHVWLVMLRSWIRAPSKAPVVSLINTLYPYCLVLVGSKNRFERDITIELK